MNERVSVNFPFDGRFDPTVIDTINIIQSMVVSQMYGHMECVYRPDLQYVIVTFETSDAQKAGRLVADKMSRLSEIYSSYPIYLMPLGYRYTAIPMTSLTGDANILVAVHDIPRERGLVLRPTNWTVDPITVIASYLTMVTPDAKKLALFSHIMQVAPYDEETFKRSINPKDFSRLSVCIGNLLSNRSLISEADDFLLTDNFNRRVHVGSVKYFLENTRDLCIRNAAPDSTYQDMIKDQQSVPQSSRYSGSLLTPDDYGTSQSVGNSPIIDMGFIDWYWKNAPDACKKEVYSMMRGQVGRIYEMMHK